ncbi:unnamed protein product [Hymenolepis diminuta]|uniref:Uncharacterized protein n=1 Tax=Hymenolepis diminuta TaxID=6216 RepID=A0A564ZB69_HYMDI|nr:unnamed protein product [Hymenolepis diminuta]
MTSMNYGTMKTNMCLQRILQSNSMNSVTLKLCRSWKKFFGQNFSLFSVRFNCLKFVTEHGEDLYDFEGVGNFHCEKFSFGGLIEKPFRRLILISRPHTKC